MTQLWNCDVQLFSTWVDTTLLLVKYIEALKNFSFLIVWNVNRTFMFISMKFHFARFAEVVLNYIHFWVFALSFFFLLNYQYLSLLWFKSYKMRIFSFQIYWVILAAKQCLLINLQVFLALECCCRSWRILHCVLA